MQFHHNLSAARVAQYCPDMPQLRQIPVGIAVDLHPIKSVCVSVVSE